MHVNYLTSEVFKLSQSNMCTVVGSIAFVVVICLVIFLPLVGLDRSWDHRLAAVGPYMEGLEGITRIDSWIMGSSLTKEDLGIHNFYGINLHGATIGFSFFMFVIMGIIMTRCCIGSKRWRRIVLGRRHQRLRGREVMRRGISKCNAGQRGLIRRCRH